MSLDSLELARRFMRRRQFNKAVQILESREKVYEQNFEYYLMLGVSCLYLGDTGTAALNFQKARQIKIQDTTLLLGQAALFLRRGDTDRALSYYLEVQDCDPSCETARKALEFIRTKGDYNTICRWVDTGKIEEFYPPVGFNYSKLFSVLIPLAACFFGCLLIWCVVPYKNPSAGKRADLSALVLTVEDRNNAQEKDLSSGSFSYILSASQISASYEKAEMCFQNYDDNGAQIEINRLLNSNASVQIKQKARLLMDYLEEPTFDKLKNSPEYEKVASEFNLYLDCWVSWSGRISNVQQDENFYRCDLLVGYESMEKVSGIVPVVFNVPPVIQTEKPVKILGKVSVENGKLCLLASQVYQSIKN